MLQGVVMAVDKGPFRIVEKVWGREEWYVNTPEYCFKVLRLTPGFTCSRHYHKKKKETFIIYSGSCNLEIWKRGEVQRHSLTAGDTVTINPGQPHRFWLPKSQPLRISEECVIYEVSTFHSDDDVVRETESGSVE